MFQVQLVTPTGRRFLLARHGWSYCWDERQHFTAVVFATKADARRALLKAYKCHGDKTSIVEVKQ